MIKHKIKAKINFPHLVQPNDYGRYGVDLLVEKGSVSAERTLENFHYVMTDADFEPDFKSDSANTAIVDGDTTSFNFNRGYHLIKTSSRTPVVCLDEKGRELGLDESVKLFEKGAVVIAVISYWFQDNQYGQSVRANVHGLKFHEKPHISDKSSVALLLDDDDELEEPF